MNNLLIYNIGAEKRRRIQTLAIRLGFRTRVVKPEEFALPLGQLAQIPGAESLQPGDGTVFDDEMLVLCNVPSQAFQAFLSGLRSQKTPVTLKAVLTEHNAAWSSAALHDAIRAEHEAMQKGIRSPHEA